MMHSDLVQYSDRTRLARELHDGIAQDLVGVGYQLDLILALPDTSSEVRSQLRTLRFTISDLVDKVRKEIYLLRQPSSLTLPEGIKQLARSLGSDFELELDIEDLAIPMESEVAHETLQIVSETLRNIHAHAHATSVTISLMQVENNLELHVIDDGVGGVRVATTRFGIQSINERALALGGSIDIASNSKGTDIWLRIPVKKYAN